MTFDTTARAEAVRLAALLAICLALFFGGLGRRALWDTDEGMHASTSKAMVLGGDWLAPQFNGKPFHDKPPAFNWLVAASFLALGFSEFAARLPAAVLGLLTVLATYRLGRRLVGTSGAFLGAIVLATSVEFVVASTVVLHDILLALFVALACFAFWRGYSDERRRAAWFMAMYASVGAAVLAKGPLGAVLPGGVVLGFLALQRDLRFVPRLMLVRGALLAAAVAVPPYAAMALRDPDYLRYFLIEKNLGSFASAHSTHPSPFYYYGPTLLAGFFPWSAFLPLALWRLLRRPATIDPARRFLLVWTAFVLLLFSAATSKLATYILPLFPALSLLVGDLWRRLLESAEPGLRRGVTASYLVLAAILVAVVPPLWLEAVRHPLYDAALHRTHLVALTAILAANVVLGPLLARRRAWRAVFAVTAATVAALTLYAGLFMAPLLDDSRSARDASRRVDAMLPPGATIGFFPEIGDSALFYTERLAVRLPEPPALEAWLERPGALAVVDAARLDRIEHLAARYRSLGRYGRWMIVEAVDPAARDHMRE